jgi:GNAT superfamily N-acetyltransferase
MNIQTTFTREESPAELAPLRSAYLDSLIAAQELLLEVMRARAVHYRIVHREETCGYFSVHGEQTLIEFYLGRPYWVFGETVFKQILQRMPVRRALVQSFDHLLLSSCIAHQTDVRSLGVLVRDYVPRALPELPALQRFDARTATRVDLPRVCAVEQPVFTDHARLAALVEQGHVVLFEREHALIGFGIMQPVVAGRPDVDVGIALDPAFRNTGYALYLFRHMVEHCLAQGLLPIAGCAEENRPSRNMGERIGMVPRYRLLELTFAREGRA